MAMDEENPSRCYDTPTDVLAEILRRLLPNSRRRCRLVCRQWRDTVDECTATNLRSRAKTLLVSISSLYTLDDKWVVRPLMGGTTDRRREVMDVVGTCNGLICFCDDSMPGGAISLANPATGETLDLPPLPCADSFMRGRSRWHTAYGFAHHQGTGQYKVVRIPCCIDTQFDTVQVLTLGETSWRDVVAKPAVGCAGTRCLRSAGIIGVDGAVYWVADGTERIMSFDLEAERVSVVKPLPTRPGSTFYLVEIYGRLGAAIFHGSTKLEEEKTDVWVLESARGEQRWRQWYCVGVETRVQPPQQLTLPHFAHGNHVLTRGYRDGIDKLYKHQPKGTQKGSRMLHITDSNTDETQAIDGYIHQAFAYVDTKEPLNIYKLW
jgi:F-box interacting protein